MDGKTKCKILKEIRIRIAEINGIDYTPNICLNMENCTGTCIMCDKELDWLNYQLNKKIEEGCDIIIPMENSEV